MREIGLNINSSKENSTYILADVCNVIKDTFGNEANIHIFEDGEIEEYVQKNDLEIMIVLGGDGTIIRAARALCKYSIPILGINIGNLGFLASVETGDIKKAFEYIKENKYNVEERMMISCSINHEGQLKEFFVLNDVVVSKGALSRMIKYKISVDNNLYADFSADGIIISTPTGSTAYGLSAGGPIIHPSLNLIEIIPICPHVAGMRPLIIDCNSEVIIETKGWKESIFMTIDGQESLKLQEDSLIGAKMAPFKCKLIRLQDYDYFKVLREKIIWRTREIGCEGE
ncbi:NAD(+)/NADH kinase [Clostridium sp. 19966]|uniref:NAD(+)/NADH kinase n=1 Tax=Clostridium sp. 19966 TaxID=2768166 RepID=UPI0028DDCE4B|nr:NAD(+)/NADH kinase [Clostridium sp. 19966]MDT8716573.1 NAD(+)/NADH kinase [Clostridium sp. 19966]